jgi:hypothetical protein
MPSRCAGSVSAFLVSAKAGPLIGVKQGCRGRTDLACAHGRPPQFLYGYLMLTVIFAYAGTGFLFIWYAHTPFRMRPPHIEAHTHRGASMHTHTNKLHTHYPSISAYAHYPSLGVCAHTLPKHRRMCTLSKHRRMYTQTHTIQVYAHIRTHTVQA